MTQQIKPTPQPKSDLRRTKNGIFRWMDQINVDKPDQQGLVDDFLKGENYRGGGRNDYMRELNRYTFISQRFEKFKQFVFTNTAYVD